MKLLQHFKKYMQRKEKRNQASQERDHNSNADKANILMDGGDLSLKQENKSNCSRLPLHLERQDHQQQEGNTATTCCIIPTEIVRVVSSSGYLDWMDLERFLLQTTKSFILDLGQESAWTCLCFSRWKHLQNLPSHVRSKISYPRLYQIMKLKALLRDEQSLQETNSNGTHDRSLQLTSPSKLISSNLIAMVSIRTNDTDEIVSQHLSPCHLDQLLQSGCTSITLPKPVVMPLPPLTTPLNAKPWQFWTWKATLHFLRLDTLELCVVNKKDASICSPDRNRRPFGGLQVQFLSSAVQLRPNGQALERYIQTIDRYETYFGIQFQVTVFMETTCSKPPNGGDHLVLDRIEIHVQRRPGRSTSALYNSEHQAKRHGVTLLQLLEQLQGWESISNAAT